MGKASSVRAYVNVRRQHLSACPHLEGPTLRSLRYLLLNLPSETFVSLLGFSGRNHSSLRRNRIRKPVTLVWIPFPDAVPRHLPGDSHSCYVCAMNCLTETQLHEIAALCHRY